MPHDAKGNLLAVGDKVNIPCKVTRIQQGDEYCNVELETTYHMFPTETNNYFALNTKQVVKSE